MRRFYGAIARQHNVNKEIAILALTCAKSHFFREEVVNANNCYVTFTMLMCRDQVHNVNMFFVWL